MSTNDFAGVYTITAPDGRVYVGSSTNIGKRWKQHRTTGRCGRHHNPALQESFERHGVEAHHFEVIERIEPGTWIYNRERAAMQTVDPLKLMNTMPGPGKDRRHRGMITGERRNALNRSQLVKLTESAVINIKTALRDRAGEKLLNTTLAREHGVTSATICNIKAGRSWAYLTI